MKFLLLAVSLPATLAAVIGDKPLPKVAPRPAGLHSIIDVNHYSQVLGRAVGGQIANFSDFDIMYIVSNRHGNLVFSMEITDKGTHGEKLTKEFYLKGSVTLQSTNWEKTKTVHFEHQYNSKSYRNDLVEIISEKELTDPANGYYDVDKDSIRLTSQFTYNIH
jgi:hypothetical protein